MYRIKCSNGKYVNKTYYGTFISYTKNGKVFHSINLARKNLYMCEDYEESKGGNLKFELEQV